MSNKNIEDILSLMNTESISYVLFNCNNDEDVQTLFSAVESKLITNFQFNYSIEQAVINEARESYKLMTENSRNCKIYADHIFMPDCLAYAIEKKDVFSKNELLSIPFDHGDNVQNFSERYGNNNLINDIRNNLLIFKKGKVEDPDFHNHINFYF